MNKKYSAAASISFDEGILRGSQSETLKKGHKINTGIFHSKNAKFFLINVLYKISKIFNQKNHETCHLLKKVKISKFYGQNNFSTFAYIALKIGFCVFLIILNKFNQVLEDLKF